MIMIQFAASPCFVSRSGGPLRLFLFWYHVGKPAIRVATSASGRVTHIFANHNRAGTFGPRQQARARFEESVVVREAPFEDEDGRSVLLKTVRAPVLGGELGGIRAVRLMSCPAVGSWSQCAAEWGIERCLGAHTCHDIRSNHCFTLAS